MSSFIIYKSTANLYKLVTDSADARRETYSNIYTGLRINIQPASPEFVLGDIQGEMGKLFRAYTTYSGCQVGMVLVTSGTTTVSGMRYHILGVEEWSGPIGRHYELVVRKATN